MAKNKNEMLARMKAAAERINAQLKKDLDKDGAKIHVVGDKANFVIEGWSCGVARIDNAFGGRIPCGRIIEIFGNESAGKTTLCHHIQAGFQKAYPEKGIAFIDAEHAMDPSYAKRLHVNNDGILVLQPDSGILALNAAVTIAQDKEADVGLIIIDSVAALTTKSDEEKNIGDATMAEQARMVSQAMRILNTVCASRGITLILTNQMRDNIGVTYGDKSTTPAGKAIRYYASVRCKLSNMGKVKEGEEVIGMKGKMVCVKNKIAPPFRSAEYTITFGIGIDKVINLVEDCMTAKIIVKKGGWFNYFGEQVQGINALHELVRKDKALMEKFETELAKVADTLMTSETSDPDELEEGVPEETPAEE
jgi:recombination protein RecA